MQDQIRFFGSTQDLCPCGSSIHYTKRYGVDIPCPHFFVLGARRPTLLDVELDIETERKEGDPSGELRLTCEEVAARPLDTRGPRMAALQKLAEEKICHFSHARRKKQELYDWVVNNYPQDSGRGHVQWPEKL
jgi:hypothetical protein